VFDEEDRGWEKLDKLREGYGERLRGEHLAESAVKPVI